MGKPTSTLLFLLLSLLVLVFVAVANGDTAVTSSSSKICNVEMTDLAECLPAITGKSPPPPTPACCKVVRRVNMPCLCKYKPQLRRLGVDPATAMALPKKCGLKAPPPKC